MTEPKRDEASQELDASLERISLGIERLQVENRALREALRGMLAAYDPGAHTPWIDAARAALAASEVEDG